jgi:Family of unknown function (DUF6152)
MGMILDMKRLALLAILGLAMPFTAIYAHHSFAAEYDANKPLVMKGKFTKMDWVNPHSWVYFDVTTPDGKVENWGAETAPPNGLYRRGWRKSALNVGDEIVIDGFAAKDGSHTMNARSVTLAGGKRLFAGSSGGDAGAAPSATPPAPANTKK